MTITPFIHDTPEWHAMRAGNVGASEIAALFGMQPAYALSHYALWQVKAGNAPPPEVNNPRTQWGLRLEEAIAAGVAEKEGWAVSKGGYVTDDTTPGLGCTLDYVIAEGVAGRVGPGALELKNSDWLIHRKTWVDGEPPEHVLLQHQAQLACTGWTWGAVGCLVGGNDLQVYPYAAKPKLIAEIRRRVTAFWQSIREGREPPVDGSDAAAAVIRAMHPVVGDEEADLRADNELPDVCARLLDAAARRREAEAEEAEAKNALAAKLGGFKHAIIQGYRVNVAVTPEKAAAEPPAGYLIPGRKEVRRITVKELAS